MALKADFNIQLQGFTPAAREATVMLRNEATGQVIQRRPFADGSLLIRDAEPGLWQLEVTHPNLTVPIERRTVRLFPQEHIPTFVPIPVPAELFSDNPIRDIPDRSVAPVQQAATAVKERLLPIGVKGPGEAIRASDFNAIVSAISDLAGAVLELADVASPKGHDHPEIAEKISEQTENLRRFAEAFGRSLVELRREVELAHLRMNVAEVLDEAEAPAPVRKVIADKVKDLDTSIQADTTVFTQKLSSVGSVLLTQVNELAVAKGAEADTFLAKPAVQTLQQTARSYFDAGTQVRPEAELNTYKRTTTVAGGTKFGKLISRNGLGE
jgi:hypothetical protein